MDDDDAALGSVSAVDETFPIPDDVPGATAVVRGTGKGDENEGDGCGREDVEAMGASTSIGASSVVVEIVGSPKTMERPVCLGTVEMNEVGPEGAGTAIEPNLPLK